MSEPPWGPWALELHFRLHTNRACRGGAESAISHMFMGQELDKVADYDWAQPEIDQDWVDGVRDELRHD